MQGQQAVMIGTEVVGSDLLIELIFIARNLQFVLKIRKHMLKTRIYIKCLGVKEASYWRRDTSLHSLNLYLLGHRNVTAISICCLY